MIDFDFASLRTIGFTQAIASQLPSLDCAPGARLLRITQVHRRTLVVHDGLREYSARAVQLHGEPLCVGDWVTGQPEGGGFLLGMRLDPVTHLARRTADGRRQGLASNVDTALLVTGLDHDFKLRRVERYLALVHAAQVAAAQVTAVVVLTKADANDAAERIAGTRARIGAAVPVVALDGRSPAAADALAPWLGAGQTLIMLGSSGAGKSTMTNTLAGAAAATGAVRTMDSRGRHTTTARSLHLCPGGACIIDTPGLRALRPDGDEESLTAAFEDIQALSGQCQFRDCRHQLEPGCAVREGVDPDRLLNYHRLLRETQRAVQTPLERIAERSRWKALMRAGSERGRQKRG
ncbi:ribosome small subunit-dependent GTPase A [Massilia sp. PAMC28688]|uniref:ribosome small subunit-dependent GTPase A n=1 Tax=Massilia sp. PAMC28688 TaxID=2861283 RepID=UPI001C62533C|nr:ribosome small subunit-dependent GTPase A [Massilia sp. PAMC28688]QYF92431.1 ribosome small subunit-dependent GTPase A [Massilia sp. PAMC28688]